MDPWTRPTDLNLYPDLNIRSTLHFLTFLSSERTGGSGQGTTLHCPHFPDDWQAIGTANGAVTVCADMQMYTHAESQLCRLLSARLGSGPLWRLFVAEGCRYRLGSTLRQDTLCITHAFLAKPLPQHVCIRLP